MFKDAGTEKGNITEVHILLERPMPDIEKGGKNTEKYIDLQNQDSAECLHLLTVFLGCFRLSNRKSYFPRINRSMSGGHPLDSVEDFKSYRDNHNPFLSTTIA